MQIISIFEMNFKEPLIELLPIPGIQTKNQDLSMLDMNGGDYVIEKLRKIKNVMHRLKIQSAYKGN